MTEKCITVNLSACKSEQQAICPVSATSSISEDSSPPKFVWIPRLAF